MAGDARKGSDKGKEVNNISNSKRIMSYSEKQYRQAQGAEQQPLRNKPQADRGSTSSLKHSTINRGEHSTSRRHHNGRSEARQAIWRDSIASTSYQKSSDTARDGMQRSYSTPNLAERPFNTGRPRSIPVLAGGGGPDDSSSQQQGETSQKRKETKEYRDYQNYTAFMVNHALPAWKDGTYTREEYLEKDKHAWKLFENYKNTDWKQYED